MKFALKHGAFTLCNIQADFTERASLLSIEAVRCNVLSNLDASLHLTAEEAAPSLPLTHS
jgi:hypothetical protein